MFRIMINMYYFFIIYIIFFSIKGFSGLEILLRSTSVIVILGFYFSQKVEKIKLIKLNSNEFPNHFRIQ